MEVVQPVVPVSVIEDVVQSKKVVESTLAGALIEPKQQRSIEAPQVEDEKMEVVPPVVPVSVIEDVVQSKNLILAGPDDTMEVVKEDGEWLGCTTEVAESKRIEFVLFFLQHH
jgi:hypothetical protein